MTRKFKNIGQRILSPTHLFTTTAKPPQPQKHQHQMLAHLKSKVKIFIKMPPRRKITKKL